MRSQGFGCSPIKAVRELGEALLEFRTVQEGNTEATCESRESVETTRWLPMYNRDEDIVHAIRNNEYTCVRQFGLLSVAGAKT